MPTELEKAWFAGMLDGEGEIAIRKRSQYRHKVTKAGFYLIIRVTNTHLPAIQKIKEMWGMGTLHLRKDRQEKGYKPIWYWQIYANQALYVLEQCFPYLIIKRDKAGIAIVFQRMRKRQSQRRDLIPDAFAKDHVLMQKLKEFS